MTKKKKTAKTQGRMILETGQLIKTGLLLVCLLLSACNIQAEKKHYILGERLFADKKYAAAIDEFKKIIEENPRGALAEQTLFRLAIIQSLYLQNHQEAVKNFRQFTVLSKNEELVYQANKHIAETFFSKIGDYRSATDQYKKLIEQYPRSLEQDFFHMRLAKSYYQVLDFEKALLVYRDMIRKFSSSGSLIEAYYQLAVTYFTKGDCEEAIDGYEDVMIRFPQSQQAVLSQFGIANCYEDLNNLEEALVLYRKLLDKYPSRSLVQAKIEHIKLRQAKKK